MVENQLMNVLKVETYLNLYATTEYSIKYVMDWQYKSAKAAARFADIDEKARKYIYPL